MKKLLLLAAVLFSFSALSFAKSVNPVKDVKKAQYELVKPDASGAGDILTAATGPVKQKIQEAIQDGAEIAVVAYCDILIIFWSDGSIDIYILC